jgi:hypothetical protein
VKRRICFIFLNRGIYGFFRFGARSLLPRCFGNGRLVASIRIRTFQKRSLNLTLVDFKRWKTIGILPLTRCKKLRIRNGSCSTGPVLTQGPYEWAFYNPVLESKLTFRLPLTGFPMSRG